MNQSVSDDQQQARERRVYYRILRRNETAKISTDSDGSVVVLIESVETEEEEDA
jgi:hypothetical protein